MGGEQGPKQPTTYIREDGKKVTILPPQVAEEKGVARVGVGRARFKREDLKTRLSVARLEGLGQAEISKEQKGNNK